MGLTDKHLAYGDGIPQTQIEKDYYWKIKHLEEQNNKLKEVMQKIKEEIENSIHHLSPEARSCMDHASDCMNEAKNRGIKIALDIIDKHLMEVKE